MSDLGRCSDCRGLRPLSEFLRVVPLQGTERPRLVCRPTLGRDCFESVGPATDYRLEPLDQARPRDDTAAGSPGRPPVVDIHDFLASYRPDQETADAA